MNGTLLDDRFPYSDLLLLQVAHALRLGYGWVRAVAWFSLGGFVNDHRYIRSINAPATGNTFDAFQSAAVKLGAAAPTVRLVPYDILRTCRAHGRSHTQLQDNGPVTGGVGALATAAPAATQAGGSSGSSGGSNGALHVGLSSAMAVVVGVAIAMLAA